MIQLKKLLYQNVSTKLYAIVVFLVAITLMGIFQQTTLSIVSIWWRSETFAHGFLIVPIVVWLVWRNRNYLYSLKITPEYRALVGVIIFGFFWLMGDIVNVLILQQFAFVSIVVSGIWTILGNQVSRAIAFPLAFLFFGVPVGEDLVPYLMEFTATFTVEMLRITGIPVYREGLYFSLPSGNWSVVRACAGIRYLIAAITLGTLFAYLTYTSLIRRVIFIGVCAIVPILANGLRAYGIVMIGHLSDMKLATGVDHLLYGWVFFGFVMLLLFWIGSIWREPEKLPLRNGKDAAPETLRVESHWVRAVKPAASVILLAMLWPLLTSAVDKNRVGEFAGVLHAPGSANGWVQIESTDWNWKPEIPGADAVLHQFYQKEDKIVALHVGQYFIQQQGDELVGPDYIFSEERKHPWKKIGEGKNSIILNGEEVRLRNAIILELNRKYLVWYLYRIGSRYTASQYVAKLFEAFGWLTFGRHDAAILFFATPINDSTELAVSDLEEFIEAMHKGVEESLDQPIIKLKK